MNDDNDVSMVYANDTADFGMIDIDEKAIPFASIADEGTVLSDSESDDGDVEGVQVQDQHHLPQHATATRSDHNSSRNGDSSNNTSSDGNLYQQHQNYLYTASHPEVIDNRKLVYVPMKLACGLCAYCSPDVLRNCPMVLRSLQADLVRAFKILPVAVHGLLKRTNLWLNWNGYAYGPKANPQVLRHVTTHHHPAWLTEVACDTPQKALGIEIYSCVDFSKSRLHWNGSGLLIHELCHLIHQCCLEDGLDNRTVEDLYKNAYASGKYEKVLRRDWAGKTRTTVMGAEGGRSPGFAAQQQHEEPADFDLAYAMVDKKEFFAELSVTFFCNAYHSLDNTDPNAMELCNPPLLHPDVAERVRLIAIQRQTELAAAELNNAAAMVTASPRNNCTTTSQHYYHSLVGTEHECIGNYVDLCDPKMIHRRVDDENTLESCCWAPIPFVHQLIRKISSGFSNESNNNNNNNESERHKLSQLLRMIDPVFRERATSRNCAKVYHCNKFYPFTRGQLKLHDPEVYEGIRGLWGEVAMWDDPFLSVRSKERIRRPCYRWCPFL
mmetsp:Transcript_24039/g.51113  ORF Transcript_24039/g.51113 Transcript_24039/m.51113 type:complete len:552 (+) Transcript_24039:132-1787(+)